MSIGPPAPRSAVPVSAVLFLNRDRECLLTFHHRWNGFTLPMTAQRSGPGGRESPDRAALRAAARAVNVPVRIGKHVRLEPEAVVSGRDFHVRNYLYDVFRAEPHPD